jgi:hypothetical protein
MLFQNFTLVTTKHKTSTVTPELAVKTNRQSPNSFGLSFGAQIAQMRLYYTALQYCDMIGTKK